MIQLTQAQRIFFRLSEDLWRRINNLYIVKCCPEYTYGHCLHFAARRSDYEAIYKKIVAASALIWRTLMVAEKRFRRLNAPHLLKDVYAQHHRKNKITIDSGKKLAA